DSGWTEYVLGTRELRRREAMHASLPLHRNDRALDRLQQPDRQAEDQRPPQQGMDPVGRTVGDLDPHREWHDDVTDQHDHQVGREVVGAVIAERLAAGLAMVGDLHEGAEQMTFAAVRAAAEKSTLQSQSQGHRSLLYGLEYPYNGPYNQEQEADIVWIGLLHSVTGRARSTKPSSTRWPPTWRRAGCIAASGCRPIARSPRCWASTSPPSPAPTTRRAAAV